MFSITLVIWIYFKILQRKIDLLKVFNVLGYTFFLPFVILQIIDLVFFQVTGWDLLTFSITHTLFLIWEAAVTIVIISKLIKLNTLNIVISNGLIIITWILICALLWR
jgi:hypothetical protein